MMPPHIKIADCSYSALIRTAKRCGFILYEGRKHCKVKAASGAFITMIPRHSRLKRETAKSIVEALRKCGCFVSYS